MRLFVAIELDETARHAIAGEQTRLKAAFDDGDRSGPNWIRPEHMHLTLAFLGEIDDVRRHVVVDVMRRPFRGEEFTVAIGGLGVFPPTRAGAPRVLWLGLMSGVPRVMDIQRQVADRVARLGIAPERRPFHPHLTLARWRRSRESDRPRVLAAGRSHVVARVDVTAVALIHSRFSPGGPDYTTLCHSRLGDSADPPPES